MPTPTITLIHCHEISTDLANSCPVAAYVKLFSAHSPSSLIKNIESDFYYLKWEDNAFPVTVTDRYHADNSYVVSIYNTYIQYGLEELKIVALPNMIRMLATALIKSIGHFFKPDQLDRVVYINNWLLSTNLYPANFNPRDITSLIQQLTQKFPNHALCFRSLNHHFHSLCLKKLNAEHFAPIGSRQVYLYDGRQGLQSKVLTRSDVISDKKLIRKKRASLISAKGASLEHYRLLESYYNMLYVDKYSALNPQFTAKWLQATQDLNIITVDALQNSDNVTIGVRGIFRRGEVMSTPVIGYDLTLPRKEGLYRQLTNFNIQTAVNEKIEFNASSGASHFKRCRGATPHIEYSAVYTRHLPWAHRIRWRLLRWLVNTIAVPLLKRFKL